MKIKILIITILTAIFLTSCCFSRDYAKGTCNSTNQLDISVPLDEQDIPSEQVPNGTSGNGSFQEKEQPVAESITEYNNASEDTSILYSFNTSDTTITVDDLPENIKADITYGILEEEIACACYEMALAYLGNIDGFVTSDWVSSVHYEDSYTQIFIINGTHYKFIIKYDNSEIHLTDKI